MGDEEGKKGNSQGFRGDSTQGEELNRGENDRSNSVEDLSHMPFNELNKNFEGLRFGQPNGAFGFPRDRLLREDEILDQNNDRQPNSPPPARPNNNSVSKFFVSGSDGKYNWAPDADKEAFMQKFIDQFNNGEIILNARPGPPSELTHNPRQNCQNNDSLFSQFHNKQNRNFEQSRNFENFNTKVTNGEQPQNHYKPINQAFRPNNTPFNDSQANHKFYSGEGFNNSPHSNLTSQPPIHVFNQQPLPPVELPFFRGKNVKSFEKFQAYIEGHCRQAYANYPQQWNQVLLKQIPKEIKVVLPPDAEFDWSFRHLTDFIKDYLNLTGPKDEPNPAVTFMRLAKQPNETVTVYSVKLLQAFRLAYPSEHYSYGQSRILIEKFMEGLPDDTYQFVNTNTLVQQSMGQSPAYETYVYLAEKFEKEIKPKNSQPNRPVNSNNNKPMYNANSRNNPQQFTKSSQGLEFMPNESNEGAMSSYNGGMPQANVHPSQSTNYMGQIPSFNSYPPAYYPTGIHSQPENPYVGMNQPYVDPRGYYPQGNRGFLDQNSNVGAPRPLAPFEGTPAHLHAEKQQNASTPSENRPGACNYCRRPGHYRAQCKLFKLKEASPDTTWCTNCLMKNHEAAHCTAKPP